MIQAALAGVGMLTGILDGINARKRQRRMDDQYNQQGAAQLNQSIDALNQVSPGATGRAQRMALSEAETAARSNAANMVGGSRGGGESNMLGSALAGSTAMAAAAAPYAAQRAQTYATEQEASLNKVQQGGMLGSQLANLTNNVTIDRSPGMGEMLSQGLGAASGLASTFGNTKDSMGQNGETNVDTTKTQVPQTQPQQEPVAGYSTQPQGFAPQATTGIGLMKKKPPVPWYLQQQNALSSILG